MVGSLVNVEALLNASIESTTRDFSLASHSNFPGFGRPVLENVLAFAATPGSAQPIATYVRNGRSDGSVLTRGQAHTYSVTVRSSQQALRATLVRPGA